MTFDPEQHQPSRPWTLDPRRHPWTLTTLVVVALVGGACNAQPGTPPSAASSTSAAPSTSATSVAPSASSNPTASSGASVAPSAAASESTPASPAAAATLAVTAKDYSFELPTTPIAAGITTIVLTNQGKEEHQAQLVKIADGKTLADLAIALQNPDPSAGFKLVQLAGGPTNVVPGATVSTTVKLEPGNYAFLCFFQTNDGIPHIAKGMIAGFQVTGSSATGGLPASDATVTGKDFSFVGPADLPAGRHTLTFKNDGPSPHEAGLVRLADGMTVDKIRQLMGSGTPPSGPPPWTSAGGSAGIAPGSSVTLDIDVSAGNYAFICFIPDPATGKSHFELGMIAPVTVK